MRANQPSLIFYNDVLKMSPKRKYQCFHPDWPLDTPDGLGVELCPCNLHPSCRPQHPINVFPSAEHLVVPSLSHISDAD